MVSQEIHCKKSLNTKTGSPPSECINSGRLLLLYQLKSYCIVLRNIVIELVQTYSKHRVLIVLTSHFIHPNPHNFMPSSLIFILKSNKNKSKHKQNIFKSGLCQSTTLGCGTCSGVWAAYYNSYISLKKTCRNFQQTSNFNKCSANGGIMWCQFSFTQILSCLSSDRSISCCHNHFEFISASALLYSFLEDIHCLQLLHIDRSPLLRGP